MNLWLLLLFSSTISASTDQNSSYTTTHLPPISTTDMPIAFDPLVVRTKSGNIRGVTLIALDGKMVDAFLGIPYAKPPLGPFRFRRSEPVDRWSGILDAKRKPLGCPQICRFCAELLGQSENCLRLNIWVPRPRGEKIPVMVWIHGGGFTQMASSLLWYDGKTLATEERIVVVTINYRLGPLGFLYLNRTDVPGNAGLWDQNLALRWIRDNIEFFGGDPETITIFGESAGGASIHYHLVAPPSKGLFKRAIIQSGTATSPWAKMDPKESIGKGLEVARRLGCIGNESTVLDMDEVVKCLQNCKVRKLVRISEDLTPIVPVVFSFVPVVDGKFLPEDPQNLIEKGEYQKMNIMIGNNLNEGTLFLFMNMKHIFLPDENINVTSAQFAEIVETQPIAGAGAIVKDAIVDRYTNWDNPEDPSGNIASSDYLIGDLHITCPVSRLSKNLVKDGARVYRYVFAHRPSNAYLPTWAGVMHHDEINYIFGAPLIPKRYFMENEIPLTKRMMKYWANFARTG